MHTEVGGEQEQNPLTLLQQGPHKTPQKSEQAPITSAEDQRAQHLHLYRPGFSLCCAAIGSK